MDNKLKKKVINKMTRGLGDIIEDENTIYCFIDEKKFKRKYDFVNRYSVNLTHLPVFLRGNLYSLRKNIVYIFDDVFFDKTLTLCISTFNDIHSYIKFRNCTFTENVIILDCDNLEVYSSNINCNEVTIRAKNLIMRNSTINSDEIDMCSDEINLENSEVNGKKEIRIDVKEYNDFSNIKSPNIIYKGLEIDKNNNSYKEIDKLIELRKKLIDTLAIIKLNEENYRKEKITRYIKEVENLPISKRLTK